MPNIEITATGNVTGAVTALHTVQTELNKTAASSKQFDAAIAKTGATLGTGLKTGANQATNAMTNLGRVIQDAPYGIIGITNNINPLLESFQRLKVETGSTKGALSALAGSLIGGGGLGLAVSVVTSLLSVFAMNAMRKTTDEGEKNEKVIDRLKDSYEKFTDEVSKLAEAASQEAVKVSVLFGALSDSNIKLDERKTVIKQLNELSPAYLGNLNAEKSSYEQVSSAINNYIDDLGKTAFIKSFLPEFEGIFKKLIETQVELRKLNLAQNGIFGMSDEDYAQEKKRLETQIRIFKQDITVAKKFLEREAGGANNLSEILFGKNPQVTKEITVKPQKIKIDEPREATFVRDGKVSVPTLEVQPRVIVKPKFTFLESANFTKEASDAAKFTTGVVQNIFTDSFASIGETLGNAVMGSGNFFGNLFSGIFKALGAGLKQLGLYAITTSKLIVALKASIGTTLGIAGGIALIALGTIISAAASKIVAPKFATGTRNFQGGTAIVGERGPERIFLPTGSAVQPNNEMMAYGGGDIILLPSMFYEGTGFRIMLNRVDDSMSRRG